MDISQALQEIERLRVLYDTRQITSESFVQAVNQLQINDAQGYFWHVDGLTLRWYRYTGQIWEEQAPPLPPVPPPAPANAYAPVESFPAAGYSAAPGYAAPPGYAPPAAPVRHATRVGLWIGLGVVLVLALGTAGAVLSGCLPTPAVALPTFAVTLPVDPTRPLPTNGVDATATRAASATTVPTQTASVTPRATAAPLPSATVLAPVATAVPIATTTRVASPAPTLAPVTNFLPVAGPWLLSLDNDTLYLNQAKKSDAINTEKVVGPGELSAMVAPKGGHVAFVTAPDPAQMRSFKLVVYDVANQRVEKVIPLSSLKTEPGPADQPGSNAFEAMRAVSNYGSLAWSEDGRQLAFVGAQDGPSSDLYSYSLDTQKVTRLTDGPSQAYGPSWSPDGKYIVQFGVSTFGTGAGYAMVGAWATLANNTGSIELYKPSSGGEIGLGWANASTFLVYSFNAACGHYNLRSVNIQPLKVTPLFSGCFDSADFDRASGTIALGITQSQADFCNCGTKVNGGLYLLKLDGTLKRLNPADTTTVAWLTGANVLWGRTDPAGALAYTLAGKAITLPTDVPAVIAPVVAPLGTAWAWTGTNFNKNPGVWIGLPEIGVAKVSNLSVSAAIWNKPGSALLFLSDTQLFAAPAPGYKPVLIATVRPASQLAWVVP